MFSPSLSASFPFLRNKNRRGLEHDFLQGNEYRVYYWEDFRGQESVTENNGGKSCINVEILLS